MVVDALNHDLTRQHKKEFWMTKREKGKGQKKENGIGKEKGQEKKVQDVQEEKAWIRACVPL